MKAFLYTQYGSPDVLQLKEVDKPTPKDDEVLVKIRAASVNALDWHLMTADIFLVRLVGGGLLRPSPSIPGADAAGQVEAVGGNARQFQPGAEVYGAVNGPGRGSFAEYVSVPEKALVLKPVNLSYEEAAAVPIAALTALQGLRDQGQLKPGQKVLIQGASGGVGTFAVQLAKVLGAEVTAVCSPRNADRARSLGANRVIDYTQEDFTRGGERYDLILGVNGYHSLAAYRRALAPKGTYVMTGGTVAQIFQGMLLGGWFSQRAGQTLKAFTAQVSQKDLTFIKELLEAGKLVPVIDKRFAFNDVPEAMRYFGTGHTRGKVVITVAPADSA